MMPILLIKQVNKKVNMVSLPSLPSGAKGGGGEESHSKQPNFVVGSKFSNYMGEEVNLGWRFIKLLLGMGL